MSDVELTAAVPVLPVDDADKAVEFYVTRLGFAKAFAFGPYAGVQRGSVMIHLDAAAVPRKNRLSISATLEPPVTGWD